MNKFLKTRISQGHGSYFGRLNDEVASAMSVRDVFDVITEYAKGHASDRELHEALNNLEDMKPTSTKLRQLSDAVRIAVRYEDEEKMFVLRMGYAALWTHCKPMMRFNQDDPRGLASGEWG